MRSTLSKLCLPLVLLLSLATTYTLSGCKNEEKKTGTTEVQQTNATTKDTLHIVADSTNVIDSNKGGQPGRLHRIPVPTEQTPPPIKQSTQN